LFLSVRNVGANPSTKSQSTLKSAAMFIFISFWKDYEPVILVTSNRLFEQFEEATSLGKGHPSVFLRIPLWLRTLNTEDMEEQIKSGNDLEMSSDYLKGTEKCQKVQMKL
jgi:hypothetical protein